MRVGRCNTSNSTQSWKLMQLFILTWIYADQYMDHPFKELYTRPLFKSLFYQKWWSYIWSYIGQYFSSMYSLCFSQRNDIPGPIRKLHRSLRNRMWGWGEGGHFLKVVFRKTLKFLFRFWRSWDENFIKFLPSYTERERSWAKVDLTWNF